MISLNKQNLYLFLLFISFLRIAVSSNVGLGVDEAHYVLYGLNLDLSYFDHPPLVGWVQYIFISVFGDGEFGSRFAAVLIGFFSSLFMYKLIFEMSKDEFISVLSVIALNASFMFNALSFMLLPDTLLLILIVPIILATLNIEKNPTVKNWLILGLLMGLAGLAKYTAVLFIVPIVLYFIIQKRYELFISKGLLISIVLAMILISPVIIWNIQNDWISFTYQSEHVVGEQHIRFKSFFQSIAVQFGAYNPFLWIVSFYGLYKAFTAKNKVALLSALFGLTLIVFFWYASLYKRALPHWSALYYYLFIPIGVYYLYSSFNKAKKYITFSIVFGLAVTLILYIELIFKLIPFNDYRSLHRDIYGWDTITKEANKLLENKNQALAVTNWTVASRAIYYNKDYNSEVFLIDNRYDQFDIWTKNSSPIGKDLLFINTHFFNAPISAKYKCKDVQVVKEFDIKLNNKKVNTIELIWCKDFQGYK